MKYRDRDDLTTGQIVVMLIATVVLALVIAWPFSAFGMNHGFNPDAPAVKWMESREQPPEYKLSCCGEADAYPVDRYEIVTVDDPVHGVWKGDYKVWIEDGRAIQYPDGSHRIPWDIAIPLFVPSNRVNREDDDLDNPTDHGWLFMRATNDHEPGSFYCFIRHPQGN